MLTKLTLLLAINSVFSFSLQPKISKPPANNKLNLLQPKGNKFVLDPFYTGRNQLLKEWEFTEPSFNFPFSGTIDDYIQVQRYKAGDVWWINPGIVADITTKNSRSPLKAMHGQKAFREIYWPNDGNNEVDINQFRIALNCQGSPESYSEKAVEIFFRNPDTGEAEPFMYIYDGQPGKGAWTPVKEIFGLPLKEFCVKCHQNKQGEMLAFPKLIFNSIKGISRSGYHSEFWNLLVSDESYWENN